MIDTHPLLASNQRSYVSYRYLYALQSAIVFTENCRTAAHDREGLLCIVCTICKSPPTWWCLACCCLHNPPSHRARCNSERQRKWSCAHSAFRRVSYRHRSERHKKQIVESSPDLCAVAPPGREDSEEHCQRVRSLCGLAYSS